MQTMDKKLVLKLKIVKKRVHVSIIFMKKILKNKKNIKKIIKAVYSVKFITFRGNFIKKNKIN